MIVKLKEFSVGDTVYILTENKGRNTEPVIHEATIKTDRRKYVTTEELNDALYNLNILADKKEQWTWEQIAEFLHYLSVDIVKSILTHLLENGYVTFHATSRGVKDLKALKTKIY